MPNLELMVYIGPVWFFKHIGVHLCSPKAVFAKRLRESCVVELNELSTPGNTTLVYNVRVCMFHRVCVTQPRVYKIAACATNDACPHAKHVDM